MSNVATEVKGSKLVITVDLANKGTASKSGKSRLIASTAGNVTVTGPDGQAFKLGLNVYQPI